MNWFHFSLGSAAILVLGNACATHPKHAHAHMHGPGCGHTAVVHDGHFDYLHNGHLHHPHGDHCDHHGPIEVR